MKNLFLLSLCAIFMFACSQDDSMDLEDRSSDQTIESAGDNLDQTIENRDFYYYYYDLGVDLKAASGYRTATDCYTGSTFSFAFQFIPNHFSQRRKQFSITTPDGVNLKGTIDGYYTSNGGNGNYVLIASHVDCNTFSNGDPEFATAIAPAPYSSLNMYGTITSRGGVKGLSQDITLYAYDDGDSETFGYTDYYGYTNVQGPLNSGKITMVFEQ